ncbi:MAG: SaoD/DsrE family protein [Candidatus Competibacterales bacterium]
MKVAYIFATDRAATYKLATMILPQLEAGEHGAEVVGMFFFDDNLYALGRGNPVGERLARVAAEKNILLMVCDQCALQRHLAEGELHQCGKGELTPKDLVDGVQVGCFPQLYAALAPAAPDQVITL